MTGVAVKNVTEEVKNLKDLTGKIVVSTGNIEVLTKKIEVTTQKLDAMVENLTEKVKNTMVNQMVEHVFKPWCELPELPPHLVGLEGHLTELKERLLKGDGLFKLVPSSPVGCGKTHICICIDEFAYGGLT
ncbi:hypothetical protein ACLB2K_066603 [Fragaria x ananassa]